MVLAKRKLCSLRTRYRAETTSYNYDLVGNRLQKSKSGFSGQTIDYTYDARDRLLTETDSFVGATSYSYDANGSQTLKNAPGNTNDETYTWDARNRLSGAAVTRNGAAVTTQYKYDDSGIRTQQIETTTPQFGQPTTVTRKQLVDGMTPTGYAQVIEETEGGVLKVSTVYGLEPVAQKDTSGVSIYLADGHSGTRYLLNVLGQVLQQYSYDAFGNLQGSAPIGVANPILYRGERFDATLQQYYNRARYYNPSTGRFSQSDLSPGSHGSPITLNKYNYAANDPLSYCDPNGFDLTPTARFVSIVVSAAIMGIAATFGGGLGAPSTNELLIPGWGAGRLFGSAIAHKKYGDALFALGLLAVEVSIGLLGSYFDSLKTGVRMLTERGITESVSGAGHSFAKSVIRYLNEPVVSFTENSVDCTIRSLDNLYNLIGKDLNTGGKYYRSLTQRLSGGYNGTLGDLMSVIRANKGKGIRMSFSQAASTGEPFIAAAEHGGYHAIVVEKIYNEGGKMVAKIIDSEHNMKYIMNYSELEHAVEAFEAQVQRQSCLTAK